MDDVGYTYMGKTYIADMQGVGLGISQRPVAQNALDWAVLHLWLILW
jgi:hypothetical protein